MGNWANQRRTIMDDVLRALSLRDGLRSIANELGVEMLSELILSDEKFFIWSAAGKEGQHHYKDYGLLEHTWEVVQSSLKMADFYDKYNVNKKVLFLAALFHDYGKTYDYEKDEEGKWGKTIHSRRIHHITRSALLFQHSVDFYYEQCMEKTTKSAFTNIEIDEDEVQEVLHAILSHHGRREWGSPVAPNTREAFILHLCDGISARLYDCETLDRLS